MTDTRLSVGFLSLGCPKNLVDSQLMAESLFDHDFTLAATPETADILIVNTCAFIEDARSESLDAIEAACQQKSAGNCLAVLVAGCMPQRYQKQMQQALPNVDGFIGLDRIDQAGSIIRKVLAAPKSLFEVTRKSKRTFEPTGSVVFSSGANAFLKIAEGCNHGCTFCAIPGIRGKHRSRNPSAIIKEARNLLGKGFGELTIIAQDIMAYGKDLQPPSTLAALLTELATLGDHYWIRILYGYPSLLTDALLTTIAKNSVICNYLDIPIQHSHPDILRAMRRAGTSKALEKMPDHIRSYLPDATLRTTALVGFPGETDEHFIHLRNYLAEAAFDHLGVFCYSREAGTPAATRPDQVDPDLAYERQAILMQDQKKRVRKRLQICKGQNARILIDGYGKKPDELRGRNQGQAPDVDGIVRLTKPDPHWKPGMFVQVQYTGYRGYDLMAEPHKPPNR